MRRDIISHLGLLASSDEGMEAQGQEVTLIILRSGQSWTEQTSHRGGAETRPSSLPSSNAAATITITGT